MAVYGNFKGTTQPGFTVGKPGAASIYGNNSSEPSSPTSGDVWMDSANTSLKIYDGTEWTQGTFVGTLEGFVEMTVEAGENLTKGDVVYISGTSGNTPQVRKAQANSTSTMPAIGIMHTNLSTGNTGHVVVQGNLTGVNTSTFTEGDVLYVSSTVAGAYQNFPPAGESNRIQNVGKITNAANGGSILVTGAGRFNATPALNNGNIFIGNTNNEAVTVGLDVFLTASGYLKNVVEDTTPQLGGALDGQGFDITGAGNIAGTSLAVTGQFTLPTADGTSGQTLLTDGLGGVTWNTPSSAVVGGYVFTQASAATTWTVTHNLGQQYLNVEVVNSNGESLAGTMNYPVIDFVSSNQLTATFATATSGYLVASAGTGATGFTGSIGFTGSQGASGLTSTLQDVTDNGATTTTDVTLAGVTAGNIVPAANNIYSLGTATNVWKDVFIGPGSLYIQNKSVIKQSVSNTDNIIVENTSGDLILKSTSGNVQIEGAFVTGGSVTLEQNDISGTGNIDITGKITCTGNIVTNGRVFAGLGFEITSGSGIRFEGQNPDNFETTLAVTNPTADRTILLPDSSGTVALTSELSGYLQHVADDTTPDLGGNLNLNNNYIDGSGNIDITGFITATGVLTGGTFTDGTMSFTSGSISNAVGGTFSGTVSAATIDGNTVTDGTLSISGGSITSGVDATFSGNVTADAFVKSGGTSSDFLKADGTTDSTAYGTGTVTTVSTTGSVNGITLTGGDITTTGTITLGGALSGVRLDQLEADNVITSAEAFSDVDTQIMTAAAIEDKIESYGYSTTTGTVTTVSTTGTVNGITLSGGDITTTGTVTLGGALADVRLDQLLAGNVLTSSDVFVNDDNHILTGAAIDDLILSKGYTTNTGDITNVGAGDGLTGGGTTGAVTLNVGAGTGISVSADAVSVSGLTVAEFAGAAIQTSAESFSDSDTVLMTAAAIEDRILSKGYTTNVGDITQVSAGNGLTGGGSSGAVTLNVGAGTGVTVAADTVSIGQAVGTSDAVQFASVRTTVLTSGSNATAGTVTGDWTLTAGSTWEATYADLAEKYTTDGPYEAGTVMKFGGDAELTQSDTHNDTRVAGVISTAPAFTMNGGIDGSYLALAGRVPVKVVGDVQPGDMLVASATPGHAQTNNKPDVGTVIGKAITGNVDGMCEALVILM